MIPATYNLPAAYPLDNYGPITLKVKDSSGAYIDFRGARVDLHVKNKKNYAVVLKWSTEDDSIDITIDSIILKEKDDSQMGMPSGSYNYDLQVSMGSESKTYLRGGFAVVKDNTISAPATYNLPDAYRGDNYGPITLRVMGSNNAYIDFRGKIVNLIVRNRKNYANVLNWSTENNSVELTADSIILKERAGYDMAIPPDIYDYELRVISGDESKTYLKGSISVIGDHTYIDISGTPTPTLNCSFGQIQITPW